MLEIYIILFPYIKSKKKKSYCNINEYLNLFSLSILAQILPRNIEPAL